MKIFMMIYLASQSLAAIGPLPASIDQCAAKTEAVAAILDNSGNSWLGSAAVDPKTIRVECVASATRPDATYQMPGLTPVSPRKFVQ